MPPRKKAAAYWVKIDDILMWDGNPRANDKAVPKVVASLLRWGFAAPMVRWASIGRLVAGHTRIKAALQILQDNPKHVFPGAPGPRYVPVRDHEFENEAEATAYAIADNKLAEEADWDFEKLKPLLDDIASTDMSMLDSTGFDTEALEAMAAQLGGGAAGSAPDLGVVGRLKDAFVAPPFTALDAKQGYWKDRKQLWQRLGLVTDEGRADDLTYRMDRGSSQTSLFDPVLCELIYRWFSPEGGKVLDPFAGGAVRGVTAAVLGRNYTGIDLRDEQVKANQTLWARLHTPGAAVPPTLHAVDYGPTDLTPVQEHGGHLVKRDDLFVVNGQPGGKARTCWHLSQGAKGLVTAGSRQSPQVNIVASMAQELGVPCRVHVPSGELTPELVQAQGAGAAVIQHKPGHNSVIIKRARDDAKERKWSEIPFGMECSEAIEMTRAQVGNLPTDMERLVVPVGSGMSLAGILWGLKDFGIDCPVVGVVVGSDPTKRLNQWAPPDWEQTVTLAKSGLDYHEHAPVTHLGALQLDPVYEAKCLPFLQPGDILWVVGCRQTAAQADTTLPGMTFEKDPTWVAGDSSKLPRLLSKRDKYDLVFSCPPYGDLEVYSEDDRDLSRMEHGEFMKAYRQIIANSVARLRNNRFACFVVADFRDQSGNYRNFVSDTIAAFLDAGMELYNEAVFLTPIGSLPMRTGKAFNSSRKLGKAHQNILVFLKGDAKKATRDCGGELDFSSLQGFVEEAPP